MNDPVSPCVAVCELNVDHGFCTGCGRSTDEIAQWRCADTLQKVVILESARKRLTGQSPTSYVNLGAQNSW